MGAIYTSVPTTVWTDDEWTALSWQAQWLWFYRKTQPLGGRFDVSRVAADSGLPENVVAAAAEELQGTRFTGAIDDPARRPQFSQEVRNSVLARDGHACRTCSSTEDLTLDHVFPWSLGGVNEVGNLQTLCRSCNARKGARVGA